MLFHSEKHVRKQDCECDSATGGCHRGIYRGSLFFGLPSCFQMQSNMAFMLGSGGSARVWSEAEVAAACTQARWSCPESDHLGVLVSLEGV